MTRNIALDRDEWKGRLTKPTLIDEINISVETLGFMCRNVKKGKEARRKEEEPTVWMLGMATNRVWYCWHKHQ